MGSITIASLLGGGRRPPSDGRRAPGGALLPASPQERIAPAEPALERRLLRRAARGALALAILGLVACSKLHVSPLAPPPHRAVIPAGYDRTWLGLVRALAYRNVPLRAIARDSGVIASDEFVTPINLYADCGELGGDRLEGEAIVSFTIFLEPDGTATRLQVNSKMRTQAHRRGKSGKLRPTPIFQCASTGRFEANLIDDIRDFVRE